MNNKPPRPNWWQLYLLMPLFLVMAWFDGRLVVGETEHIVIQIGAVLMIGWLVNRWISANEYKILRQSSGRVKATLVTHEPPETSYSPIINLHDLEDSQSLYTIDDSTKKTQTHFPWYAKN
jgi:hypothetical protein